MQSYIAEIVRGKLERSGRLLLRNPFGRMSLDALFDGAPTSGRFLNLGGGARFRRPGWITLDHPAFASPRKDLLLMDLLDFDEIPAETGTFDVIYCSHLIEHLPDAQDRRLLREARRILRPGGVMRIVCPDIDLAISAYQRDDRAFFDAFFQTHGEGGDMLHYYVRLFATELCDLQHAKDVAALAPTDRNDMRAMIAFTDTVSKRCSIDVQRREPNNHLNYFNCDRLSDFLEEAGFARERIVRSGYGQSRRPELRDIRVFDATLPLHSLFVEVGV